MTTSILKRAILFCSFITAGFMAEAQFTFGPEIQGGLTAASLNAPPAVLDPNHNTIKTNSNTNLNFSIGMAVAFQFDPFWAVSSGAFYQYIQPTFVQSTNPSTTITDKLNYINIPLEIVHVNGLRYKGWYYGVGANFGLGISGTDQRATVGIYPPIKTTIKFDGEQNASDSYTHYKFLNMGAIFKFGYMYKHIYVGADANLGLTNIAPNGGSKYKLNAYGLHVGYTFGSKVPPTTAPPSATPTP